MRCIVISLARAMARRRTMIDQLQFLDIEFEILSAKDWQQLTEQDYALVDTETREQQGRN